MARKIATGIIALALTAATGPAFAVPYCVDRNPGLTINLSAGFGGPTQSDQSRLDGYLMDLKRRGIEATSVEKWNGCLRAFVRNPDGKITMQYYDPNSLEQVF